MAFRRPFTAWLMRAVTRPRGRIHDRSVFLAVHPAGRKERRSMKIKTIAMAAAAGCVLAVGGGVTAYASIPDSGGVIHGCYNKGDGSLSVIDTSVVSTCPKGQNPLNWNQTGQQGPPGPPGQQGPP